MKDDRFEPGDVICGIVNNGYGITNENMFEALVVRTIIDNEYDEPNIMVIKILSHSDKSSIGEEFDVVNSTYLFRLVPEIDDSIVKSEQELKEFLFI